jgi:sirohydrochlorin cobaltochelatase
MNPVKGNTALALLALAFSAAPNAIHAQGSKVGTVIVAHGADAAWNAQVEAVAAAARTGGPVAVSFLMGPGAKTTRFQDVVRTLAGSGVREIIVVPLLISSHSGHYEQIRYLTGGRDDLDEVMMHHLHMGGLERANVSIPVRLARAIDDSPDVARILAERSLNLATAPATQALFIIGHGPNSSEDNAAWMGNLRAIADSVGRITGFRDVKIGLVQDDAPAAVRREAVLRVRELIELQHAATKQDVVVVPVLISKGVVSTQKLPKDLEGLPIAYTPEGLLPSPLLARWVEQRVAETAAREAAAR